MIQKTNSITMAGRLLKDAETQVVANGSTMFKFSIVHNQTKKVGEEWISAPFYFDCVHFTEDLVKPSAMLVKGADVVVVGVLKFDVWQDKITGEVKKRMAINCDSIQLNPNKANPVAKPAAVKPAAEFVEDIPF